MLSTILPWAILIATAAAALYAAREARRARKCMECIVPVAPATVVVQRNGGGGEE